MYTFTANAYSGVDLLKKQNMCTFLSFDSARELSLSLVNVLKFHFTKNTQSHARKKIKQLHAHDWMIEVSRASAHLLSQGKIPKLIYL